MEEERVIDLREPFQHGGIDGQFVAHLHKRSNDKNAHLHGALAIEDVRGLERTVFGKSPRAVNLAAVLA